MIDSHCHLADKQFAGDLPDVLKRAGDAGVSHMVTIADDLEEAEECIRIAEEYSQVFCTVGVHPHAAKLWKRGDGDVLKEMVARSNKVKAIGEIGLDYHYDHSPRAVQRGVFLEQLTLSRELGIPAVLHCREAMDDLRPMVEEVEPLQMVLHCCTEKWENVEWIVNLGHFISFTGMATFPKLGFIRDTIKHCPLERMMIETDSPYLAPEKYRGKRNEPAYVTEVARCIADIKGMDVAEVERVTGANALAFFGMDS